MIDGEPIFDACSLTITPNLQAVSSTADVKPLHCFVKDQTDVRDRLWVKCSGNCWTQSLQQWSRILYTQLQIKIIILLI